MVGIVFIIRTDVHAIIILIVATLHLLYARFIAHFLCKIGLVRTREPFQKLLSQVNGLTCGTFCIYLMIIYCGWGLMV